MLTTFKYIWNETCISLLEYYVGDFLFIKDKDSIANEGPCIHHNHVLWFSTCLCISLTSNEKWCFSVRCDFVPSLPMDLSSNSSFFIEKSWLQNLNWRNLRLNKSLLNKLLPKELPVRLYVTNVFLLWVHRVFATYPNYYDEAFYPIPSTSYGDVVEFLSPSFAWSLSFDILQLLTWLMFSFLVGKKKQFY